MWPELQQELLHETPQVNTPQPELLDKTPQGPLCGGGYFQQPAREPGHSGIVAGIPPPEVLARYAKTRSKVKNQEVSRKRQEKLEKWRKLEEEQKNQ